MNSNRGLIYLGWFISRCILPGNPADYPPTIGGVFHMAEKSVSKESFAVEKKQEHTGKKLRVAIIGCGGISEMHLGILRDFPDVQIVAGVDIKPERLDVMKEKF